MSDFISTQMSRLRESKQVRYGGYALLTSLGMVAALVLVNLLVDQFGVEADLTQNRLFTLSDQTIQLLDNLDADVTVYQIGTTGARIRSSTRCSSATRGAAATSSWPASIRSATRDWRPSTRKRARYGPAG